MKVKILFIIVFILLQFFGYSQKIHPRNQTIKAVEYFIDVDPGEGKGILITDTFTQADVSLNLQNFDLPVGKTIYVRFYSSDSLWSAPVSFKRKAFFDNSGAELEYAEYFINTDPGQGKGTSISFTDGNLSTGDITLNTGDVLFFRVRDNFNRWSNPISYKQPAIYTNSGSELEYAEYFINTDPGQGKGTSISFTDGNLSTGDITLNTGDVLFFRVRDDFNRWSNPISYKQSEFYTIQGAKLAYAEYYINADPGKGKGINIAIKDSVADIINIDFPIIKNDSVIHIRVKDNYNRWSQPIGFNIKDTLFFPPSADFEIIQDTSYNRDTIKFINKSVFANSYSWNFGDSATSTEKNPEHIYKPGEYIISLTASNNAGKDIITKTVLIKGLNKIVNNYGSNLGTSAVTVNVYGWGFKEGTTIILRKDGVPEITGNSVTNVNPGVITVTLNLKDKQIGIYDVIVQVPRETEPWILKAGFTINGFEGQQIAFGKWENFKVVKGTNTKLSVYVPNDVNDLFLLVKKAARTDYVGLTWQGGIKLYKDSKLLFTSNDLSGDIFFQGKQFQAGWYNLQIWCNSPGNGIIKVCSALDTLSLNNWKVCQVLRTEGSDWLQMDIPDGQSNLYIQTDAIGTINKLDIYYDSFSNSNGHWKYSNCFTYELNINIPNPKAGRYYLKFTDHGILNTASQVRQYVIIANTTAINKPAPKDLSIISLSTYEVGQGPVTIDITGTGLDTAATVSLIKGTDTIKALNVTGDTTFRKLSAYFDLASADTGQYKLMVRNPDTNIVFAPKPIFLNKSSVSEQKESNSNFWVEIIGRSQIRLGRKQKMILMYGNRGSIDCQNVYLSLDIPVEKVDSIKLSFYDSTYKKMPKDGKYIIFISRVPANTSSQIEIELYSNTNENFKLEVNQIENSKINLPDNLKNSIYKSPLIKNGNEFENIKPGDIIFQQFADNKALMHEAFVIPVVCKDGVTRLFANEYLGDSYVHQRRINFTDGEKLLLNEMVHLLSDEPFIETKRMLYEEYKVLWDNTNTDIRDYIDPQTFEKKYKVDNPDWATYNGDGYFNGIAKLGLTQTQLDRLISWGQVNHEIYNFDKSTWGTYNVFSTTEQCGAYVDQALKSIGIDISVNDINFPYFQWSFFASNDKLFDLNGNQIYNDYSYCTLLNIANANVSLVLKMLSAIWFATVWSSDPEDKYGTTGFINGKEEIDYRIDFWNKEDATAPAQQVSIKDTLNRNLNDTTLSFTEFGFLKWKIALEGGQIFNINVDMRPDMNLIVNAVGKYNPDSREISYSFRSLDPATMQLTDDPMAGFLPPIDSTGYQIGWVSYKVQPNKNLPSDTTISNRAWIDMDSTGINNPAPKAGPWTNTLDASSPVSLVNSDFTHIDSTAYKVMWNGHDNKSGSGIRNYAVYISDNDSTYYQWQSMTTDTSGVFVGKAGHNYKFYSIATDNVGNTENNKTEAEATLYIPTNYKINGTLTYDNNSSSPMNNTKVFIKNIEGTIIDSTNTDASGNYSFNEIKGKYLLYAKTSKSFGGVDPVDALLVNRKFIGSYTFVDELKQMAADVTGDGKINPTDALTINRRFIGIITKYSKTSDWLYESDTLTITDKDTVYNFKTLCYGDVNGSRPGSLAKNYQTIELITDGIINKKQGEMIDLPVKINRDIEIGAIGLKFKIQGSMFKVVGVSSKIDGLIYKINEDGVNIAWSAVNEGIKLNAGETIIIIRMKASDEINKDQTVLYLEPESIISDYEANILSGDLISFPKLVFNDEADLTPVCYPNPASSEVTIDYPGYNSKGKTILELFTIDGRLIESMQIKGNLTELNISNLAKGMFMIKISDNNNLFFRKIVKE